MKNPTLREIAAACSVNVSTVSRALSHHPGIPIQTRAIILNTARKLGWKPNPLASAYMSHLRSTRKPRHQANLAFVVALSTVRNLAELPPYHREVYLGAKRRAESQGYSLDIVWMGELENKIPRLNRLLRNRGVLGVVLHGGDLPEEELDAFDWPSFAVASWGFSIRKPLHRAAHHLGHAVRLAVTMMRSRGYERLALVHSGYLDEIADHAALSAFLYELRNIRGIDMSHLYDYRDSRHPEKMRAWIRNKKPDAIIGDQFALDGLRRMNWSVPRDIAFVTPYWGATQPAVAGIDHLTDVLGSNVVDLVISQIVRNERGLPGTPKLLFHEGQWRDGASLPDRS